MCDHTKVMIGRFKEHLPSSRPLSQPELTDDFISMVIAAIYMLYVTELDKKANWLVDNYPRMNQSIELVIMGQSEFELCTLGNHICLAAIT